MTRAALGLAAVLLCIAAAAGFVFAQQVNQGIESASVQARLLPAGVAPEAALKQLQRPGVRVDAIDHALGLHYTLVDGEVRTQPFVPPPPPVPGGPAPQPPAPGRFGWIFHTFGVNPQRVQSGALTIIIHPDDAPAARFFALTFVILALLYALSLFLLHSAAKAAERAAMQPLVQTTAALEALAQGDFTPHTIPTGERADLSALAQAFTRASQRVARAIAEEAEARAQMRQFIGDAGHELRTPITIVNTYLDVLSKPGIDDDTFAKITGSMRAEMKRMRRLVENLLSLTRMEQDSARNERVDAVTLASEAVDRLSRIAGAREIAFSAPPSAAVSGDARDIADALNNLIENALKYGAGSDVRVAIAAGNGRVSIDVDDAGPGVEAHDRARLFDRFFRGANAGGVEGSGLGLAIAKLGIERSGGTLRYEPLEPGSRFHIELPAAAS